MAVPGASRLARLIYGGITPLFQLRWKQIVESVLLAGIVLCSFWLRVTNIGWDQGFHLHPDERAVVFAAQDVAAGRTSSAVYGQLHLNIILAATNVATAIAPDVARFNCSDQLTSTCFLASLPLYDRLMWVGRIVSAAAGAMTGCITYLMARRHYGGVAGLFACLTYEFAVINIQNSLFATPDTLLTMFCSTAVYALAFAPSLRRNLLVGIFLGLSVGCKASGLLLLFPVAVRHIRSDAVRDGKSNALSPDRISLFTIAVTALFFFIITNLNVVLDPANYVNTILNQIAIASGTIYAPFTVQYANAIPFIYPISQQATWFLGPTLTMACYLGFGLLVKRAVIRRDQVLAAEASWIGIFTLLGNLTFAKLPRYWLPVFPSLSAHSAGLIWPLGSIQEVPPRSSLTKLAKVIAALVISIPVVFRGLSLIQMFSAIHPWVDASQWIYKSVPPQQTLIVEQWDDSLPLDMPAVDSDWLASQRFVIHSVNWIKEPDDGSKLRLNFAAITGADFVIVASSRNFGPILSQCHRFPFSAAYYRLLFAEKLGFDVARTFDRYPNILGWSFGDDPFHGTADQVLNEGSNTHFINLGFADESFTVYDHPRVYIFRNIARLSIRDLTKLVEDNMQCQT